MEVIPGKEPEGVQIIEHTADFGLEVEAPSLEACFARAAAGLFSSFAEAPVPPGPGDQTLAVELEADSLDELLVLWLEELLFRAEEQRLLFALFEVDPIEGTRLTARAIGRRAAAGESDEPPVKGVTRHDLWVRKEGDKWRAHVIVDV